MKEEIIEFKYYLKREKGLSENTLYNYISDVEKYIKFIQKYHSVKYIETTTKENIDLYLLSEKKKSMATKTLARKISSIKSFYKFLYLEKIINEDISSLIKAPKIEKTLPEVLTKEEVQAILRYYGENLADKNIIKKSLYYRNYVLLNLMYSTGLRVSECSSLKIKDIHLNQSYLITLGKGNKERMLPIDSHTISLLRMYIVSYRTNLIKVPTDYLFLNYQGTALSRKAIWEMIKEVQKELNIEKNITPHTLRHSFATHLLTSGMDLRFVQELLGHEDIKTTQIYTHLEKSELQRTYQKTHPRSTKK